MKLPLNVEGFEGRDLAVETAGLLKGARILIDGQPANKGPGRGKFVLVRNDGFKVVAQLRTTFLDPVPQLVIDGERLKLAESLSALKRIWSALPLALLLIGGGLGGAIGGTAFWINMHVFRSEMSTTEKYLLVGMISAIAAVAYLLLATAIATAIRR